MRLRALALAATVAACEVDAPQPRAPRPAAPGTRGRDLDEFFTDRKDMTNELCAAIGSSKGFLFAGTQSSTQSFCGNHYGRYAPGGRCGDRCAGNVYEICGGSWSNLIYWVRPAPAAPVPEPDQR